MVCVNIECMSLVAVLWGSMEIILFAGVIFGWHNIVYVYKDQGYFSYLCPVLNGSDVDKMHSEKTINTSQVINYFMHAGADNSSTLDLVDRAHVSFLQDSNVTGVSCETRYELAALESRSNCNEQDEQFNIIFSLATLITGAMCIINGYFYDRVGTRACRILAMICVVPGLLFLIFSTPEMAYLLYPGYILLSYGGYIILITNLQISGLVPRRRSMLIAAYCGSYDTSSTIFLFFKLAYENYGVSPNICFTVLLVLFSLIVSFSTFCLLPKDRIPWPRPTKYKYRPTIYKLLGCKASSTEGNEGMIETSEFHIDDIGSAIFRPESDRNLDSVDGSMTTFKTDLENNKNVTERAEKQNFSELIDNSMETSTATCETYKLVSNIPSVVNENETVVKSTVESKSKDVFKFNSSVPTFKTVVLSPLFISDVMWLSCHRLRSWMFIGVFNPWITRLACGDKNVVSHYTSFLSWTMFIGIFTASLSGCLMDRKIKNKYNNIQKYERMHASIASFVLNCTVGLCLCIGMTIPVLQIQYVTCLLATFHRSFLYGPNNAFIANAFSMDHFGKLIGVSLTVSAIFGMLQYPLFLIIQGPLNKDPLVVNVFICVLILCSYLHPVYIRYYLRKKCSNLKKIIRDE